jgi:hypothetical protein
MTEDEKLQEAEMKENGSESGKERKQCKVLITDYWPRLYNKPI